MSTLFTFPGQGAQRPGMLHDLPKSAAVECALAEASEALHRDVLTLDNAAALQSTVATQLCLLVAGVAMAQHVSDLASAPDAVAGFSVGAYAAAVTASVISYRDAVLLVNQRARLMEAAYPTGFGMVAVLGLEQHLLQSLIAKVHTPQTPVYLANINAPTQLVAAGAEPALARLAELALSRGATSIKPIAISVPSHCELLAAPAARLAETMAAVKVSPPRRRIYSACLARELRDARRIADDLAQNMARPVRWHETMLLASERGARLVIEMPPGHVLTQLANAALPERTASANPHAHAHAFDISIAAAETRIDTIVALMAREAEAER